MAKTEGTQIICYHPQHRAALLYQRDDKPQLAYANMWALPGGMIEPGETPLETIVREIDEEIGIQLDPTHLQHYRTRDLHYGIEHTFTTSAEFDIADVTLTEGQALRWFTETDTAATELAYEDNAILTEFFTGPPEPVEAT